MNKNTITTIIIILILVCFTVFITVKNKLYTVVNVISPTMIEVSSNHDKTSKGELICIDGVEAFTLFPDEEFINKYSKKLIISKSDIISLGYLAQEYAQKSLTNRQVSVIYTPKQSADCKYAKVKYNGLLFSKNLSINGYGFINNNEINKKKYDKNLEQARKLNLVILNHHSDKYHKLDCPYGEAAHDSIIIPANQLPKTSKPCKFCHDINENLKRISYTKSGKTINIIKPSLKIADGSIKMFLTDYTTNLKPNTSCSTNVCKELVHLINSSTDSIDIAIYGYDNIPAITSALMNAKNRGVKIRYVYDEVYEQNKNHYKDNNIIIQLASDSKSDKTTSQNKSNYIMHNKFLIFDERTVFTGSLNISRSGLSDYDVNNIIIVNSKEISALYKKEFEQMLNGIFHHNKRKLNIQNKFLLGNTKVEIYFSPKDNTDVRIIELINNAKEYIYIPTFLITHKQISEALIKAQNRGVDVRVIVDANSTNSRNSKNKILRANGILLKTENYAGKLHSKSIIIDDKYLITGSMNFSNSGITKNDENTLIIENSTIAKAYKQFFLYLWTLIPNKYLKRNARAEAPESIGSCSDGVDNNFNGQVDNEEAACNGTK